MHAEVLEHYRGEKIIVFKMKAKKHYRKKTVRACSRRREGREGLGGRERVRER